jgi:hypothetical protein
MHPEDSGFNSPVDLYQAGAGDFGFIIRTTPFLFTVCSTRWRMKVSDSSMCSAGLREGDDAVFNLAPI